MVRWKNRTTVRRPHGVVVKGMDSEPGVQNVALLSNHDPGQANHSEPQLFFCKLEAISHGVFIKIN